MDQKAASMSPKHVVHASSETEDLEKNSLESVKAIRADAFDQFIEERLQRTRSDGDQSEFEIVCHVY
jgi:hypothetical protein